MMINALLQFLPSRENRFIKTRYRELDQACYRLHDGRELTQEFSRFSTERGCREQLPASG
jgi:hypothetical protein